MMTRILTRSRFQVRSAYRRFLEQLNQSRPVAEALESRVMMSVAPVADDWTNLGFFFHAHEAVSATTASGMRLVAWDEDGFGVYYSIFDSSGILQVESEEDVSTGVIGGANVTSVDVAVNDAGKGVISWVADNVIYVQQLSLESASLLGSALVVPAYTDPVSKTYQTPVSGAKIAIDASGDFVVGWKRGMYRDVQPAEDTEALHRWFDAVYVDKYDSYSETWLKQPIKVSLPSVTGGQGSAADDFDIVMNSSGSFVVGWDVTDFKTKALKNADGTASYWIYGASVDTYFQRYSALGETMGARVAVGHHVVDDTYDDSRIVMAMDRGGAFTLIHQVRRGYTNGRWWGGSATYQAYSDTVYRRSFDKNGKATTGEVKVAQTDVTEQIASVACTYDDSHRLLLAWSVLDTIEPEVHFQTLNSTGSRVESTEELPLNGIAYKEVHDLTLHATGDGVELLYIDWSGTNEDGTFYGDYNMQRFSRKATDAAVSIGKSAFMADLQTGGTAAGSLPVIVANVGNAAIDATASIHLVFSINSELGDADDVSLLTTDLVTALKLKAGASQTISIPGLQITPAMYMPGYSDYYQSGNYTVFATVTLKAADGTVLDKRTSDNTASSLFRVAADITPPAETHANLAIKSAQVKFSQERLVPGDVGWVTVVVQNMGLTDYTDQELTIVLSARPVPSADYYDNDDIALLEATELINLKAGAVRTFRLRVNVTADVLPGAYRIYTKLVVPSTIFEYPNWGTAVADAELSDRSYDVIWGFGNIAGRSGNTVMTFKDEEGAATTYSLSGKGYALLDVGGAYGNEPPVLRYFDTAAGSSLTVKSKVWAGPAFEDVEGYADIGSITIANAAGAAGFLLGAVDKVTLGDMDGGYLNIRTDSTKLVNISMGQVWNFTLTSCMAIGALSAVNWSNGYPDAEPIAAPTINSLVIKGDHRNEIDGSFYASILLWGTDLDGDGLGDYERTALKSVSIADSLLGNTWDIAGGIGSIVAGGIYYTHIHTSGSIGSIKADSLSESSIYAGVTSRYISGGMDDMPGQPVAIDEFEHTDAYFDKPAIIGSITLTNKLGFDDETSGSTDFLIAAASVGTMNLGRIDTDADMAVFGISVLAPASAKQKAFGPVSFEYVDGIGKIVKTKWTPVTEELIVGRFSLDVISRAAELP